MGDSAELRSDGDALEPGRRLLSVGEKLSEISYHFDQEGSLGILYVDASPMAVPSA